MSLQVELLPFQNVCVAISARQRHTITLLRRCEARSYATYGSGKHRRHIRRLPVVLRAGLYAAIFTKRVCRTPYGIVRRPLAFHVSQRVYSLQKLIFTKRLQP